MSVSEEFENQKFTKGKSGNPGGRPKGAKNKRTQKAMEISKTLDCDPFEVLINFAKGDWKALGYKSERFVTKKTIEKTVEGKDEKVSVEIEVEGELVISPDMRLHAARDASPYLYPKLRTVEFVPYEDENGTITTFKFVQVQQANDKPVTKKKSKKKKK